jgi:amidase
VSADDAGQMDQSDAAAGDAAGVDERLLLDTCGMADLLRTRQTSASELLEVHLTHIARHNDQINAIVTLDADGARAAAAAADADLANGITHGPLHGVPFTLKDCHATAGMRTTAGWPGLADYLPASDGTMAARLKAAGGILLGKTNVAPLLADVQTDNAVFGRTNNPWNIERTPGGSSGGAAAAVAAGFSPLDIGSDIGGSIRIPAHDCGIFGLKPTERRVSNHGHIPDLPNGPRMARIMNACGPMARSLPDLALGLALIQGRDGLDTELAPSPADGLPQLPTLEPAALRIAWSARGAGAGAACRRAG